MQSRPRGLSYKLVLAKRFRNEPTLRFSLTVCDTSKKWSSYAIYRARAHSLVCAYSQAFSASVQPLWLQWQLCVCVGPLFGSNGLRKAKNMSRAALVLIAALVKDRLSVCLRAVVATSNRFLLTAGCICMHHFHLGIRNRSVPTAL